MFYRRYYFDYLLLNFYLTYSLTNFEFSDTIICNQITNKNQSTEQNNESKEEQKEIRWSK